jgi:1-deoxy-D-xylulose-5-phosphate synthase
MTGPPDKLSAAEHPSIPADLRRLPITALLPRWRGVARIPDQSVSTRGGHFAAGLGTVELTIALHYVFDTPMTGWSGTWDTRPIRTRS